MYRIEKAAVLGAGTMGAQLAAHLANAGINVLLLDIAPHELNAEESAKGLTVESGQVRDRIARAGLEAAKKAKPAAFFTSETAHMVEVGNFMDDMERLKDCDLILEAIVENLEIKRRLYEQVEQYRRADAIVATNTSGIPVTQIAEGRTDDFKQHFLGAHFFNPPRYLHLCELISTEWTKPEVACFMHGFLDKTLGKGVVVAKDRPNFIANRIGTYGAMQTINAMVEGDYTVAEIDKITGQAIGRPKTATFRTFDLVGLDILAHVSENLYHAAPEDEERDAFIAPEFLKKMIGQGILGNKSGGGFYQRQKGDGEKREIWQLDVASLEYKPAEKVKLPALDMAKNIEATPERIKTLMYGKDHVGEFLWKTLSKTFIYTANRIPEIADTVVEVDRAMRWGFGWELGVFETWDAVGFEKSVARIKEERRTVPEKIERMITNGVKSFYKTENGQQSFYDFATQSYKPVAEQASVIILKSVKERTNVVKRNSGASLIDLGDGVACLEFHSKMNTLGGDTIQMIRTATAEVEKNFVGMVVGNQAPFFSVGANLMLVLMTAQDEEWDDLDLMVREFQNATMRLRYSAKPVVTAPFGLVPGGACEVAIHGDRVRASAETYIGLVEVGVGVIPAGGGTKEMLLRACDAIPADMTDADPFPFVKRAFETIALAKVSTSAEEARKLGFLRSQDRISMNADRLIADAKQDVLALAQSYTEPQQRTDLLALGESGLSTLKLGIHQMKRGGFISDYDAVIGEKVAHIICGGDLNHTTRVSEQRILDLEREAFLSLCGMRQTQERMAHMLKTGKPLRN